jgi:hypothetical protein
VNTPKTLYHGSLYKQTELMPGFKRSGKLTVWDGVESNLNLYTTTEREEAILLGIGSALEKTFNTDRYRTIEGDIWIYSQQPITLEQIYDLEIYLYTIPFRVSDGWVKNNNPYNDIDTEWLTRKTIRQIKVERVDLKTFLKGRGVTITQAPMDTEVNQLLKRYAAETKIYRP